MRKYYLFIIKGEYKDLYIKDSKSLYNALNNLYRLKIEDVRMGISVYNQICNLFNPDLLINYVKDKYNLKERKNKYLLKSGNEEILIKFNHSCVIIYTNRNIPKILKVLYLYNKNIFVVDFKNEDYFWLVKETLY